MFDSTGFEITLISLEKYRFTFEICKTCDGKVQKENKSYSQTNILDTTGQRFLNTEIFPTFFVENYGN